jgi:predicted nucleic acid-binding protein
MAKVFLDTNVLIDIVEKRKETSIDAFHNHELILSPLSVHILFYVTKNHVPQEKIQQIVELLSIVPFSSSILETSLLGPTNDFEDNVQLHSAAASECDVFLTEDKKILDMKFFGKVKITSKL